MTHDLKYLGLKVRDRISGMAGVIVSVSFDLTGCVQGFIRPVVDKDMKPREGGWYDLKQLEVLSKKPVLDVPNFAAPPGAQAKGAK